MTEVICPDIFSTMSLPPSSVHVALVSNPYSFPPFYSYTHRFIYIIKHLPLVTGIVMQCYHGYIGEYRKSVDLANAVFGYSLIIFALQVYESEIAS